MIIILATLVLFLYLLIPLIMFRFVLSFWIPLRRSVLSRPEEIYQAIFIALAPFLLTWFLVWFVPPFTWWPCGTSGSWADRRAEYETVVSAVHNEEKVGPSNQTFRRALTDSSRRQLRFLWWFYLFVLMETMACGRIAHTYGRKKRGRIRSFFARRLIFKQISGWHFLLTPFLFPTRDATVEADILSTGDVLYQGRVYEYALNREGDLVGLALALPFRFDKDAQDRDIACGRLAKRKDYWVKIPGNRLYLFADKIQNINLRYSMPTDDVLAGFVAQKLGVPVSVKTVRKRN